MKSIKFFLGVFCSVAMLGLSSCDKDDDDSISEDTCKTCSATVVQVVNGETFGTSTIDGQEYCGAALQAIEDNPSTTITQSVGGLEQVVTTTYSCQ